MFTDQKTLETQKMLGALSDLLKIPRTQLMKHVTQHINLYDYLYTPRHEIYNTIKDKMGWEKTVDTFEHMDCQLHELPFYIQTLKIPQLTTETLYNSGLIRQGLMTRDEAMSIENEKLNNPKPPKELESFLKDIKMSYDDFINHAQELGKAEQYNPKMGTMLRKIYHSKRKILDHPRRQKTTPTYKNHPKQTQPTQPYNYMPQKTKKPYTSTSKTPKNT